MGGREMKYGKKYLMSSKRCEYVRYTYQGNAIYWWLRKDV
jgi:hypothetical protein